MKIKFILFSICIISITSCIKEVHDDFNYKSKIVIYSYITDRDSLPAVTLLNNAPTISNIPTNMSNYPYIKNAVVTIKNEQGNSIDLSNNNGGFNFYFTDSNIYKFKAGQKYFIDVSTPDGRIANASLKFPLGVNPNNTSIDTSQNNYVTYQYTGPTMNRNVGLSINFNPLGDYYLVYARIYFTNYYKINAGYETTENGIQEFYFTEEQKKPSYFVNEQNLNITATIQVYSADSVKDYSIYLDSVEYVIAAAEENYYKFLKSVETQSSNTNDPFAEPALLFSNINQGLGIFTGFTVRSKKIKFK